MSKRDELEQVSIIAGNLGEMFGTAAVVLVMLDGGVEGQRFTGGALCIDPDVDRKALAADLPKMLRQMADDAERDLLAPAQNVPHQHVAKGGGGGAS